MWRYASLSILAIAVATGCQFDSRSRAVPTAPAETATEGGQGDEEDEEQPAHAAGLSRAA